jgi:hypothetical protein
MIAQSNNIDTSPTAAHGSKRAAVVVLLRPKAAARALGVSLSILQRLVKHEGLPYVPIGALKLFLLESLYQWAKARETTTANTSAGVASAKRRPTRQEQAQ